MKRLVVLLAALAVAAGIWASLRMFRAAPDVDRELVARELKVAANDVKLKRIVEIRNLGYYCVFFRIDRITLQTRNIVADGTRYYDANSRHPWTAFLPFHSQLTLEMKDVPWWTLGSDRKGCTEWVSSWGRGFRVNIIIRGETLFGFMENTCDREATPGPF